MGNDIDPREKTANPYASPRSEQAEEKPRRQKTKWRIIPMALLAIFSSMQLIGHALMLLFLVGCLLYFSVISPHEAKFRNFLHPLDPVVMIPLAIIGIMFDIAGLMAARYCWQGRWWLATGLAAMFIGSIVAGNLLGSMFE